MTIQTPTRTARIIARFSTPAAARAYRAGCIKPGKYALILGDDERVWLTTNRDASALMRAGYELA